MGHPKLKWIETNAECQLTPEQFSVSKAVSLDQKLLHAVLLRDFYSFTRKTFNMLRAGSANLNRAISGVSA
jgi:hypothetical protein